ncbi:MAG: hypothetical protein ISQ70_04525 [Pirellulales bacterium]|nr:hypothetical protein [Pirellulales bacterium]
MGLATLTFESANRAFPLARIYPAQDTVRGLDCGGVEPSWAECEQRDSAIRGAE